MSARRTLINLLALAAATAALLVYALTQLLLGLIVDPTYPLSVRLQDSGGLLGGQEVTVSGRVVGRVEGVAVTGEAVLAELAIHEGERIPADAEVVVLRRSPIGEQAIDFRPVSGEGPFYEPGDIIEAPQAVTPVAVQSLLEQALAVLEPVDTEAAGELVGELAAAVRGRRADLRGLLGDSADLAEAVAANERDVARFLAASRTTNAALAGSRRALARSIGETAEATEVLAAIRGDLEGLLADGTPALADLRALAEASQSDLVCTFGHLAAITTYLNEPEQRHNLQETLRLNRWFFEGVRIGGQPDAEGRMWNRIHSIPPQAERPESYLPDKRPVPAILPGGACVTPLGAGAPAAAQPGFSPVTAESEIVAPQQAGREGAPRE